MTKNRSKKPAQVSAKTIPKVSAKMSAKISTVPIEPSTHQTLCKIQGEILKKGAKVSFKNIIAALLNNDTNAERIADLTIAFNAARKV